VAVGPEDDVTRLHETVLEQDVLADAPVDVENLADALALGEVADDLLVVGHLLGVGRGLEVEGEGDLVGIPDLRLVRHLVELQDAVRAAEIAGRGKVDVAPDPVPYLDFLAGSPLDDLLDHRLAHGVTPPV